MSEKVIPPKFSGVLKKEHSLTKRLREGLLKHGDRILVKDDKERNSAYQRAKQIGINIVSRKIHNEGIYVYRDDTSIIAQLKKNNQ